MGMRSQSRVLVPLKGSQEQTHHRGPKDALYVRKHTKYRLWKHDSMLIKGGQTARMGEGREEVARAPARDRFLVW